MLWGSILLRKVVLLNLLLVQILIITSCASTTFLDTWRESNYLGQLKKVFVVSVDKDQGRRSLIEDEFVLQFNARGTDAIASTKVLSVEDIPKWEIIEPAAKEKGADSVLMAKFIRKETEDTYTPKGDSAVQMNFSAENESIVQIPEENERELSYVYKVVVMHLVLYNIETGKPIWSSRTKTKFQGARTAQIKSFVGVVIRRLAGDKLIK
jgi:hypothetical protein